MTLHPFVENSSDEKLTVENNKVENRQGEEGSADGASECLKLQQLRPEKARSKPTPESRQPKSPTTRQTQQSDCVLRLWDLSSCLPIRFSDCVHDMFVCGGLCGSVCVWGGPVNSAVLHIVAWSLDSPPVEHRSLTNLFTRTAGLLSGK